MSRLRRLAIGLLVFLASLCGVFLIASPSEPETGTWTMLGSLLDARSGASATLMPDGGVVVTGGRNSGGVIASVERVDVAYGSQPLPSLLFARADHTSTLLKDGRLLVAGGTLPDGSSAAVAEIFSPASGTWTALPMKAARSHHTASLLPDGRVLVAGGDADGVSIATFEVFDPAFNRFANIDGTLTAPRTLHAAALLPDGCVLVAGGFDGANVLSTTDVFDPSSDTVTPGPSMSVPRARFTATALLKGDVLVTGGTDGFNDLASAERYVAATGMFEPASTLSTGRRDHLALRLPANNGVLVAGGTTAGQPVSRAELFLPESAQFVLTGETHVGHRAGVASGTMIAGTIMVAGGDGAAGVESYRHATIRTDKEDYAPGTTVTITGSGWIPGETVTLTLVESPELDDHLPLIAVADESGRIVNTDFAPDVHDIGVRFYLTARGGSSEAQMTFTDNRAIDSVTLTAAGVTVPPGALTVAPGSTISASVTVTTTGSGTADDWRSTGWQVATSVGTMTCDSSVNVTAAGANTSTFNITPPTAPGTYDAYFIAYDDTACSTGASAVFTLSGAVVVDQVRVASIVRTGTSPSNAASVSWTVTFNTSVSGVDSADFALASSGLTGSPAITGVTGSGATRTVTASTGGGTGTLGLNLVDNDSIVDGSGNKLGGTGTTGAADGSFTGPVYDIDRTASTVTDVTSSAADGAYSTGAVIPVQVTFSEAVTVTGTPQLTLETGASDAVVTYTSGSGTSMLTFTYTVAAGHTSADLNYLATTALVLNGGTIKDAATNTATLTLPALANASSLGGSKNLVIDTTSSTVTGVTSSATNGSYWVGAALSVQVTFNEAVTVTGTPQLTLETGASDAVVDYASGSGSTTLAFTYTVAAGHTSADLNCVSTSALALNGGTVKDAAGNTATLTVATSGVTSLAGSKALVVDGIAPTITNVTASTINGTYGLGNAISLQVTFSEAVTVTGTPQLTLETGATDAVVNYASGSGTATLTFTYTVAAGHASADLDYVSPTALALNGGAIRDVVTNSPNPATLTLPAPGGAGSLGANKALVVETTAPTVTNVTSSAADGTYGTAGVIPVQVTFSEAVTVTGTPRLTLETGATDALVNYTSGSGTATLTFTYTVAAGHNTADLDYVSTSALALNGGTIRDVATNNATLTLPAPGAAGSLGANKALVVDAVVPTVTGVTSSTPNGSYAAGTVIPIEVNFSEAVTVTGAPQLTLETGVSDAVVNYTSGSGTSTLTFTYTVAAGHTSADLNYLATTALALNGGTIKDLATNTATLTLPALANASSLGGSKNLVIDTTAPTVTNVTSSTVNGTYGSGAAISIQVTFSEAVTVTGTPQLTLETGASDAVINYASGSGGVTLTFTYPIAAAHTSADLDYLSTSALALNGGTLRDAATNNATLTLATPGAAGSLGANKALVVDGIAPTVTNVTSSTANGSYGLGNTISIQVTFSEVVNVTGTPQLTLETGATDAVVNYASGTGSATLTFTYTVAAGHASTDLDYLSTAALALNSGAIRDTVTNSPNAATLTLPAPGAVGSLGANKALVVETTAPTVTDVTSSATDGMYPVGGVIPVQVTFSEAVTVTGTPRLTLETGTTDAVVSYASGSGTATLTFTYTVAVGHTNADLDYLSTGALALNAGTIKDLATNNAILTLPAPGAAGSLGANKAIVVDGVVPTVTGVTSSTTNGSYGVGAALSVQVTFNEAVTVTGTPQLTLETGATDAVVDYASGSGSTTLAFTYTVAAGHTSADLNCVSTSALALNGGAVKDAAGNTATLTVATSGVTSLAGSKALVVDGIAPTITNVTASTINGTYGLGNAISLQVTFSEAVTVTGTPQLTLETGATDAVVNYASGSGTATLTFTYTVAAGHASADLDYVSPTALALNGGTIRDVVTNSPNGATLTLPAPGGVGSLGANKALVVETTAPTVTNVTSSAADGTYGTAGVIPVQVTFSEVVTVTGTPRLTLETGATDALVNYTSGSGTATLTFTYTVAAGHNTADLDYVSTGALALNAGTIKDLATNTAILTLPAPGAAGSLGANKALVVDAVVPTVTGVTSSTPNGSYAAGTVIPIEVNFSEAVTVTGAPQLTLETGVADAVVNYTSGSGTSTLTFTYTVAAGHTSADLNYLATTALALNGGTIKDLATNTATLTLPALANASSLGGSKNLVIDTTASTVSSVTSSTANGSYGPGSSISIQLNFNEAVTVTGIPQLTLETGASDAVIDYISGSGTTSLTFSYAVAAEHTSADLNYVSTSALALNDGTLQDAAGNNATLTLPALGGGSSLAGSKALVVDGIAPTVTNVTSTTADGNYFTGNVISIRVTFSESVAVTGTPQLTLETGASDAVVNYTSGSGTATLTFTYTVAAGDASTDLDYVSTTALALNSGTIRDVVTNNPNTATLTLPEPGAAGSLGANRALVVNPPPTTITGVTSSTPNGAYKAGGAISIQVTFSASVTVTGTPQLTLETGASDAVVNYAGGSGSATLTFDYTVAAGDTSDDLDYQSAAALALNGGTIEDGFNINAVLTLPAPGAADSLGASKDLVVDTTPPSAPTSLASSPVSPANNNQPRILGVAEADSTVTVYADDVCSSPVTGTDTANAFASPGISVNVTDDTTTLFYAQATDVAGNTSACSTSNLNYVEDSTAPTTVSIDSVSSSPTNASSVSWVVTFSENVSGVDSADFALATTGLGGTPAITGVAGGPTSYTVTAATGTGSGSLGLNLVDDDSIVDGASNRLGGTGAGNGDLTGQAYVVDRTLTPHITAGDKIYNGNTVATITSRTLTGNIAGGNDVSLTGGTASFDDKNVGTGKTVTATGLTLTGADAAYYILAPAIATTTADITKKTASVTPDSKSKIFGAADPTLTGTLSGFIAGDAVTATYTRVAGETVAGSPYAISASLGPAGILGNYAISATTANFTITPKNVTTTAVDTLVVYTGTSQPLTLTATVTGSTVNEGYVKFTVTDPAHGNAIIGSPTIVPVSSSRATGPYMLPAGTLVGIYRILAEFFGASNFGSGADDAALKVQPPINNPVTAESHFEPNEGFDALFGNGSTSSTLVLSSTNSAVFHYKLELTNKAGVDLVPAAGNAATVLLSVPALLSCGGVPCPAWVSRQQAAFKLRGQKPIRGHADSQTDDLPLILKYKSTGVCEDLSGYDATVPASGSPTCIMVAGFALPMNHKTKIEIDFEFRWLKSAGWPVIPDSRMLFRSSFVFYATIKTDFLTPVPATRKTILAETLVGAGRRVRAVGGTVRNLNGQAFTGYKVRLFTDASLATCRSDVNLVAENTVDGDGFYIIWRKGKNQSDTAAPSLPAGVRYRVEVCAPPSGTTPARQLSLRALTDQLTTYEYDEESFLYP